MQGYPVSSIANDAVAVTPSDTVKYAPALNGLFVGTGVTTLTVVTQDGSTVAFTNVPNGAFLPIKAAQVMQTGTDATDIVGFR